MVMEIAVNGKYLGAPLNGVHRTALLFTRGLLEHREAAVEVLSPRNPPPNSLDPTDVTVQSGLFGTGQGWEMLTLPRAAKGKLLINFCNVAPLLHSNSVVMMHDAQTFLYPQDYTGRQAAAYRALLPLIGRRARRVLTVSNFSRQSLADHGIAPLEKIGVVYNGTDHILDTPADSSVLERFGLQPGKYALTLGSNKGYKNMRRLFEVFADPPLHLQLVLAGGAGKEGYGLTHGIIPKDTVFTGRIDDGALRALYENAFVFLFPSLTEGFGLPPVEAMHCHTPVVAARAGAVAEVCENAALLVEPEDTQQWRDAIISLADEEKRQVTIKAGEARASTLTWASANEQLWKEIGRLG